MVNNKTETVAEDIAEAQSSMRVGLTVTDGKIVCDFNIADNTGNYGGKYTSYPKVFDNFADFVSYAEEFFKEELTN